MGGGGDCDPVRIRGRAGRGGGFGGSRTFAAGVVVELGGSSGFAPCGERVGGLGLLGSGFGVLDFPWGRW